MTDWRIFQGNQSPDPKLVQRLAQENTPPWRHFDGKVNAKADQKYWKSLRDLAKKRNQHVRKGKTFRVRKGQDTVVDVVNAALYLRRPLLIEGKPGSGKTSLAYAIAYELNLAPILLWPITASSKLQDALFNYDAIARLQDSQLPEPEGEPGHKQYRDIGQYIRLGPVGTAFLPSKLPRVLLIDEVDKSDINLPNDLLNLLEEGEFDIPPLVRVSKSKQKSATEPQIVESYDGIDVPVIAGKVQCHAFPIVIMTSNGERDFPPAFLRRCLRVTMPQPTVEDLTDIVIAHLGATVAGEFEDLIQEFAAQDASAKTGLATDQLLNTIFLCTQNADLETLKSPMLKPLSSSGGP